MTADLKAAVAACPQQKIVLLGYSQGGKSEQPRGDVRRRIRTWLTMATQLSAWAIRLVEVGAELSSMQKRLLLTMLRMDLTLRPQSWCVASEATSGKMSAKCSVL